MEGPEEPHEAADDGKYLAAASLSGPPSGAVEPFVFFSRTPCFTHSARYNDARRKGDCHAARRRAMEVVG